MSEPSTPAALDALRKAMDLVESAQGQLGKACQQLGRLRYGADLYKEAGKQYDAVHKLWYVLEVAARSRARMSVDSEPEP